MNPRSLPLASNLLKTMENEILSCIVASSLQFSLLPLDAATVSLRVTTNDANFLSSNQPQCSTVPDYPVQQAYHLLNGYTLPQ